MGNISNRKKDILTYSVSHSSDTGDSVLIKVPIQQADNYWNATDIIHHVRTVYGYLPGPMDRTTFGHLLVCLKRNHRRECFIKAEERIAEASRQLKEQKEQEDEQKHKDFSFRVFPEEDILKQCTKKVAEGKFEQIWTSKLRSLANRRVSETELNQLFPVKQYDAMDPGSSYYCYWDRMEREVVYRCSDYRIQ